MYRLTNLFFKKESSSSNRQIDSLDGLRGIAILFVFLAHTSDKELYLAPWLNFWGAGHYGVFLFFVLSAFLLTLPPVTRPSSQFLDAGLWAKYAARRVLRIFPLYSLILLVSYAGVPYFYSISKQELVRSLILLEGKGFFWPIPIEFAYYLILPVLAFFFVVVFKKRETITTVFVVAGVCLISLLADSPRNYPVPLTGIPFLPIFLMGSLTALLHSRLAKLGEIKSIVAKTALDVGAIIIFLYILYMVPFLHSSITGDVGMLHYDNQYVLFAFLWSSFLFSYLNGRGFVRRILEAKPLRFVGIISFSIYLWHIPVISFINENVDINSSLKVLLIALATLIVSAISYLLIEKPFMNLDLSGRRLKLKAVGPNQEAGAFAASSHGPLSTQTHRLVSPTQYRAAEKRRVKAYEPDETLAGA